MEELNKIIENIEKWNNDNAFVLKTHEVYPFLKQVVAQLKNAYNKMDLEQLYKDAINNAEIRSVYGSLAPYLTGKLATILFPSGDIIILKNKEGIRLTIEELPTLFTYFKKMIMDHELIDKKEGVVNGKIQED